MVGCADACVGMCCLLRGVLLRRLLRATACRYAWAACLLGRWAWKTGCASGHGCMLPACLDTLAVICLWLRPPTQQLSGLTQHHTQAP